MDEKVTNYVGRFATEKEIAQASTNPFVYYGNHLFDHDVPLLLSDEELVSSYVRNREELKKYANYRDMFAFPFGQPGTCFSDRQADLLIKNGAKRVFNTSGKMNPDVRSPYLNRLSLSTSGATKEKIWLKVFCQILRGQIKKLSRNYGKKVYKNYPKI
jgi:hypothetical protein